MLRDRKSSFCIAPACFRGKHGDQNEGAKDFRPD